MRKYFPSIFLLAFFCIQIISTTAQRVPTPISFFGYEIGADYHLIDYEQSINYFRKLEASTNRMQLIQVGTTSFDRPWYLSVISTPDNLAKLEDYRQVNQRLVHPEGLDSMEMAKIIEDQPVFVDINGGLHANEVAGSQLTLQLAYELLSKNDKDFSELFSKTILILWPTVNPDGQDIVAHWYDQIKGTKYSNAPLHELYQKYVGHDNNRDGFMLNMQESRVLAGAWRHWEPEILHVHHQMGKGSNYSDYDRIWFPPFAKPVGVHTPERMLREMNTLGMQMSMELDTRGLRGATHMGTGFDSYYLGYNDYMEMYHNIVAFWTESNSGGYAEPYYISPDTVLKKLQSFRPRSLYVSPWRGGWWRLKDQIDYMIGSDYGLLKFAAHNRKDILFNRYMAGKEAIDSFGQAHDSYAYIIPRKQRDQMAAVNLLRKLGYLGIRISELKASAMISGTTYPAGTWVVKNNQEFGGLIEEMLGVQHYPEIEEYPGGPLEQPYDVAGWTLPYYMDVNVVNIKEPLSDEVINNLQEVKGEPVAWKDSGQVSLLTNAVAAGIQPDAITLSGKGNALAVNPAENNTYKLINRTFANKGTVRYVKSNYQEELGGYYQISGVKKSLIEQWAKELYINGRWEKQSGTPVRQLRIGIYSPWNASMDEGWTRWILEKYGYEFIRIRNEEMRAGNLNEKYDVVIFASIGQGYGRGRNQIIDGLSPDVMPEPYAGGIGKEGVEALKIFVINGGRMVCIDQSVSFAIDQFKLPIKNAVQGMGRKDFFAGGSILRAQPSTNNRLMTGLPEEAKICYSRGYVLQPEEGFKGDVLMSYPAEGDLLLSGYLTGEKYLRNKAAAARAEVGKGDLIMFGFAPQWRAQTTGTFKVLFNCLYGE